MASLATDVSVLFRVTITTNLFICAKFSHNFADKTLDLGSKSAYEWISGYSPRDTQADNECHKAAVIHNSLTCSPIHANVVYRHGTRFPSSKYVKTLAGAWSKLHAIKQSDLFSEYQTDFREEDDKNLAQQGSQEMCALGTRFGHFYCDILNKIEPHHIKYVSSSKARSLESAEHHRRGLYNSLGWSALLNNMNNKTSIIINDDLMRYFKKCSKYRDHLNEHRSDTPAYLREHNKFMKGPEMSYVTESISKELDIHNDALTNEETYAMYYIGAFDYVLNNKTKLLNLFDASHLEILNYLDDIKTYWKKGYGYPINYEITCGLLKDVYNGFNDAITQYKNNQSYTAAILQFGHAETIIPIHMAFGLHKDNIPLRADNFESHINRAFRSSTMAPFAGNIAFILHRCRSADMVVNDSDFFVQTVINEKPINLPDCDELCPLSVWTDKIRHLLDLDFDTYCDNSRESTLRFERRNEL